jgi:hypothetical protein
MRDRDDDSQNTQQKKLEWQQSSRVEAKIAQNKRNAAARSWTPGRAQE